MRSLHFTFALAFSLTATLQFVAPTRADDNKANLAPKISKMTIDNGGAKTVYYTVNNGTPRLNALYRKLEFAENEVTIVQQLQLLRLDYVHSERLHEASSAVYGFGTGFSNTASSGSYGNNGSFGSNYGSYGGGNGESTLKNGLSQVLAAEGTPDAAMQAIQVLERAETDAANELKLLTPQDQQQLKETTKKMHDFVVAQNPNAAPAASK